MPKKAKAATDSTPAIVYQLKVTLNDVKPTVWRRLHVGDCSLAELHAIIQACMGWSNCHSYAFDVDCVEYSDPSMGSDLDYCDSHSRKLSELASQGPGRFSYQYDFGDDWKHVVRIETTLPVDRKLKYPRCIGGKRACPPEDCGGAYGYEEFLESIQNRNDEQHDEMLEWVGGKFDPEAFEIARVNRRLQRIDC
jgi:hypothetical protein